MIKFNELTKRDIEFLLEKKYFYAKSNNKELPKTKLLSMVKIKENNKNNGCQHQLGIIYDYSYNNKDIVKLNIFAYNEFHNIFWDHKDIDEKSIELIKELTPADFIKRCNKNYRLCSEFKKWILDVANVVPFLDEKIYKEFINDPNSNYESIRFRIKNNNNQKVIEKHYNTIYVNFNN